MESTKRKKRFSEKKPSVIFLVGPTACGKSAIAVCLAKKLNAEIISCDAMQVYKGMDILTAKPSLSLRKKVAHHLIDFIPPCREYNVFRYRKEALKEIKRIISRDKVPLVVGGTGLYMSVLVDGIFDENTHRNDLRKKLYRDAEKEGNEHLYARLKAVDTVAARKIHPNDRKRIVRALEIFEATGKPISLLQQQRKGLYDEYRVHIFCVTHERKRLYQRIEERVEQMLRRGIVAEVKALLKMKLSRTAYYAIGIREFRAYFEGRCSLLEAKELMKRNSRRYAKRQLTWFRKDSRIRWITLREKETPCETASRIWKRHFLLS